MHSSTSSTSSLTEPSKPEFKLTPSQTRSRSATGSGMRGSELQVQVEDSEPEPPTRSQADAIRVNDSSCHWQPE